MGGTLSLWERDLFFQQWFQRGHNSLHNDRVAVGIWMSSIGDREIGIAGDPSKKRWDQREVVLVRESPVHVFPARQAPPRQYHLNASFLKPRNHLFEVVLRLLQRDSIRPVIR